MSETNTDQVADNSDYEPGLENNLFLGKDKITKWLVTPATKLVRKAQHNIIVLFYNIISKLPGV